MQLTKQKTEELLRKEGKTEYKDDKSGNLLDELLRACDAQIGIPKFVYIYGAFPFNIDGTCTY